MHITDVVPDHHALRSATDCLVNAAEDSDADVINELIDATATYGDLVIPHLQAALTDLEEDPWLHRNPAVAWEVVAATLLLIGSDAARTAAVDALVRSASVEDPMVVDATTAVLAGAGCPCLPPQLRAAYEETSCNDVREAICRVLVRLAATDRASLDVIHDHARRNPGSGCLQAARLGGAGAGRAVLDGFDALPDLDAPDAIDDPRLDHVVPVLRALRILDVPLDPPRWRRAAVMLDTLRRRDEREVLNADNDRRDILAFLHSAPRPGRILRPGGTPIRTTPRSARPGPNSPCTCGSGRKAKKCCG